MDGPRTRTKAPAEIVVLDQDEACPYLEGRVAHRPMRLPTRPLSPAEFDARLEAGDRRAGLLFYNQACVGCRACEALRIDPARFVPTAGQRRAYRKGARALELEVGPLLVDATRVRLFERHQRLRGLKRGVRPFRRDEYEAFLVEGAVDAFELRYVLDGRLVGVAIVDRGEHAWSAVYTFYEPELPPALRSLSIGTFSVLTQIERARAEGVRWLYLGLAVHGNAHMRYKLDYLPHERRIGGAWRAFARGDEAPRG